MTENNIDQQPESAQSEKIRENKGSRRIPALRMSEFANADQIVRQGLVDNPRSAKAVDIMLVNPPTPDGGLWIRTQHRVGRRTRENMVWPQVSLAQMAAMLHPVYSVKIVDANAERMSWEAFTRLLDEYQPRYYFTQLTAPTLENDMYGVFLAKARQATTIAFGTHITPIPRETMAPYPALDYGIVGEPDLTIRDLLDHLEGKFDRRSPEIENIFSKSDADYRPSTGEDGKVRPGWDKRNCVAQRQSNYREFSPPIYQRPGSPANANARTAAIIEISYADDQGTFHFHRDQPRLPCGLHVLHQTRQLPVFDPPAFSRPDHGRNVALKGIGYQQHPYVCGSLYCQQRSGGGTLQTHDFRGYPHPLDMQQPR